MVWLLLVVLFCVSTAQRPPASQRRFVSVAVDKFIQNLTARLADSTIATMFEQCFPNTLDTTVYFNGPDDSVVITGDINAMWLRDSCNQVLPYIQFANVDSTLDSMLYGLIRRQTRMVLLDPYANSFQANDINFSPNAGDDTRVVSYLGTTVSAMNRKIFERKFEIDSLCAFLKLGNEYFAATNNANPFVVNGEWVKAVSSVADVFEQRQDASGSDYYFTRQTSVPTDTLWKGTGGRAKVTGMLHSPFRPSDDATTFPFLVPANAMASVELNRTANLLLQLPNGQSYAGLSSRLSALASSILAGIRRYGTTSRNGTSVYAFEVDGFGNSLFMDDGNVPSLLSLPLLGFVSRSDPLYVQTRNLILSSDTNPFFFSGKFKGVGSPHTDVGSIWHLGLIVQAMTSNNLDEIKSVLDQIKTSTAGTNFMHESFSKDDPFTFTRPWFAWANSLFGQMVIDLVNRFPSFMLK